MKGLPGKLAIEYRKSMQPKIPIPGRGSVALLNLAALIMLVSATGCRPSPSESKAPAEAKKPAKVELLPHESDLARITLTPEAERRLGITTAEVAMQSVSRRRFLSGQVVVPSGRTILVTAPLAGEISVAHDQPFPVPGQRVTKNQSLLYIDPLLSVERDVPTPAEQVQFVGARATLMAARTVAAGDVQRSQAEVDAATIALERARKLFSDRAGPQRAVDDADAQLNIANSNLEAARQREQQLAELLKLLEDPRISEGEATSLPMSTPINGILNRMEVREGQTIASGAVLFEVVNLDSVWIRVPVFVDQLSEVDPQAPVKLVRLSGASTPAELMANPVSAPPTADTLASTVDLYYELDNSQVNLNPGQRVGVELPLITGVESLTVPNASVLYDIYGNAWVYSKSGDRQFQRERVEVRYVDGSTTVLETGPKPGTIVVVDGAAELFGTEFGAGK
jgi:multidrug efflux pump subunit AcrA (membrane-fusion protein)